MDFLLLVFDKDSKSKAVAAYDKYIESCDEIDKLFSLDKLPGRHIKSQYTLYPYLLADDFDNIPENKLQLLLKAGIQYYSYIINLDRIIDEQTSLDNYELIYRNFEAQMAIRTLTQLFDDDNQFWRYFFKYNKEFIDSIILERQHLGIIKRFEESEFERIARGKSAVAKLSVVGLGCLSKKYDEIDRFEATQDYFADSFQLYDDLRDWKEDFRRKNYSWLLTEIMCNIGEKTSYTEEEISYELFVNRYDEAMLDEALRACDRSMITAGKSKPWIRVSKIHYNRLLKLREDFSSIRNENYRKYSYFNDLADRDLSNMLKEKHISVQQKMNQNLLLQQAKGYVEMRHWLGFPHEHGFTGEEENQEGIVFQHAFIVNLLNEINDMGFEMDNSLIKTDLAYWMNNKHKDFSIAWGYFPDLPELSPDIDTYSEVIRVLQRQGFIDEQLIEEVEFVLDNNMKMDGSMDTWIIDKNDKSEAALKAYNAAVKFWGTDPDPEVIANFIYTVTALDQERFGAVVQQLLQWLLSKQNEEGYWTSSWYVGKYYGSYVCAKLFDQVNLYNENVERLIAFLSKTQNENGSWGELSGNPQDTAYALAGILFLKKHVDPLNLKNMVMKAVSYLLKTFDFDMSIWYSCDFIYMDMGRATGQDISILKYSSVIITSVICFYGLCKGIKYLQDEGVIDHV